MKDTSHRTLQDYAGRVTVTDGAWGTQLQARGLPSGACPDTWNLQRPEAVEAVARDYLAAGSQVVLTNTFRANRFALERWGLADQAAEIARAGARISRRAVEDAARVFASIGPTGKLLMMGEVGPGELFAAFAEQADALARGGADAILCETFTDLEELKLALRAARESTDLPVVASMTFDSGPDGTATMMGVKPADLARAAEETGAAAVGANCGAGPEHLAKIAARYLDYAEIIELHHHLKADAPSGTAIATAKAMAVARGKPFSRAPEKEQPQSSRGGEIDGVTIHSVRLPGLLAHQEVLLGAPGQTLSIRHDTVSRECYMPGVILAIKEVVKRKGLIYGLDTLLGL